MLVHICTHAHNSLRTSATSRRTTRQVVHVLLLGTHPHVYLHTRTHAKQ